MVINAIFSVGINEAILNTKSMHRIQLLFGYFSFSTFSSLFSTELYFLHFRHYLLYFRLSLLFNFRRSLLYFRRPLLYFRRPLLCRFQVLFFIFELLVFIIFYILIFVISNFLVFDALFFILVVRTIFPTLIIGFWKTSNPLVNEMEYNLILFSTSKLTRDMCTRPHPVL